MESRRAAIKLIGFASLSMPLLADKALACLGEVTNRKVLQISTPRKGLLKFYEGTLMGFFNLQYQDHWSWSSDITLKTPETTHDIDLSNIPIGIGSNTSDLVEAYCSQVDIVYEDKRSPSLDVVYLIASFTLQQNTLPEIYTRYRMSSLKASIYAALTYRDIRDDKVLYTKISKVPARTRYVSCDTDYQFRYGDA